MFTIADIIDLAIQIEKNGERFYRQALKLSTHPSLDRLLQRLADEEVEHAKWFSRMKRGIKERTADPRLEEMGRSMLQGVLGEQSFSLADARIEDMARIEDLWELAIEFEKDTVVFFEMIAAFVEDEETLGRLAKIIEEEKRHIQMFQEIRETGSVE